MLLTEEEVFIINEKRKEEELKKKKNDFRKKVLKLASEYNEWLIDKNIGHSFSDFVNSFCYQEHDGKQVYDAVCKVLDLDF